MKDTIKQIIKTNLPEKKKVIVNMLQDDELYNERGMDGVKGFNQALSQINTSLIADEVLKVVVEKLEKVFDKHCNYSPKKIESEEEYGYNKSLMAEAKLLKFEILQLLSNLSTNKENKSNSRNY